MRFSKLCQAAPLPSPPRTALSTPGCSLSGPSALGHIVCTLQQSPPRVPPDRNAILTPCTCLQVESRRIQVACVQSSDRQNGASRYGCQMLRTLGLVPRQYLSICASRRLHVVVPRIPYNLPVNDLLLAVYTAARRLDYTVAFVSWHFSVPYLSSASTSTTARRRYRIRAAQRRRTPDSQRTHGP